MIYLIDNLVNTKKSIRYAGGFPEHWVIARPIPDENIVARLKAAWAVFMMKADAVRFVEHPMDLGSLRVNNDDLKKATYIGNPEVPEAVEKLRADRPVGKSLEIASGFFD